jgi:hypothetical protein
VGSIIWYSLFYKGEFVLRRQGRLEGVLYVDDSARAVADEYPDHVEAYSVEVRLLLGEVPFGQSADGGLLAGGDGFERIAEAHAPAHLNLDEDERLGLDVQSLKLGFRAVLTPGTAEVRVISPFLSLECLTRSLPVVVSGCE